MVWERGKTGGGEKPSAGLGREVSPSRKRERELLEGKARKTLDRRLVCCRKSKSAPCWGEAWQRRAEHQVLTAGVGKQETSKASCDRPSRAAEGVCSEKPSEGDDTAPATGS